MQEVDTAEGSAMVPLLVYGESAHLIWGIYIHPSESTLIANIHFFQRQLYWWIWRVTDEQLNQSREM